MWVTASLAFNKGNGAQRERPSPLEVERFLRNHGSQLLFWGNCATRIGARFLRNLDSQFLCLGNRATSSRHREGEGGGDADEEMERRGARCPASVHRSRAGIV